jgi:hypothetical protein
MSNGTNQFVFIHGSFYPPKVAEKQWAISKFKERPEFDRSSEPFGYKKGRNGSRRGHVRRAGGKRAARVCAASG